MGTIIKSTLMIIAAAVIVGGVTKAAFSDSKTINNNTFSAGTLAISLANPNGSLPFTISNWAPGQTTDIRLDIKNTGTLDSKVTGTVSGKWDFSGLDGNVSLENIQYWNGAEWANPNLVDGDLQINAGQTLAIKATVKFSQNAGNEYQGKTYRASFTVNATQAE